MKTKPLAGDFTWTKPHPEDLYQEGLPLAENVIAEGWQWCATNKLWFNIYWEKSGGACKRCQVVKAGMLNRQDSSHFWAGNNGTKPW